MINQIDLLSGAVRIGYARVSTSDQCLDSQIDLLKRAGCSQIYKEMVSGINTRRVELDYALKALRKGDTLVVCRLDRLGRSLVHLVLVMTDLKSRSINLESLNEKLDTTTATGQLMFNFFAVLAEFERNLIRERTKAGLLSARARGRKGGRKPKLTDSDKKEINALIESNKFTITDVSKRFNVSRMTIYKALNQGRTAV